MIDRRPDTDRTPAPGAARHRRVIALAPDAPVTEQDEAVRRYLRVLTESKADGDRRRVAVRAITKRFHDGGRRLLIYVSAEVLAVRGRPPHFRTLKLPGEARLDEIAAAIAAYRHLVATAESAPDGDVDILQQRIVHPPNGDAVLVTVICGVCA